MHTKEIEITKNEYGGWSVHTIQHWDDFPAAHTHKATKTLAWAIYGAVSQASNNDTLVTGLTVKGKPYPREKAEASIRKSCEGTLSYTLKDTLAALAI